MVNTKKKGKEPMKGPSRAAAESELLVISSSTKHENITRILVNHAKSMHAEVGMEEHHQDPPYSEGEEEGDTLMKETGDWSTREMDNTAGSIGTYVERRSLYSLAIRRGSSSIPWKDSDRNLPSLNDEEDNNLEL